MAPLPTLFALLCSVAVLLVLCDAKIFTDANDNDLYKERQRPAKTVVDSLHHFTSATISTNTPQFHQHSVYVDNCFDS
ncbi:hypothetical protein GPALN_012189 [Globodera pallida]|nr:hypothetical protein GPALN_012189 [Globodera pallida]